MRCRPSSRLLVLDPAGRVLLFRFVHAEGVLAGRAYWAAPGGAVEARETFETAAIRELKEETGLEAVAVGPEVGRKRFAMGLPSGEQVMADERYFMVRTSSNAVCTDRWTHVERVTMVDHRWWTPEELAQTTATVFPGPWHRPPEQTSPDMLPRLRLRGNG